MFPLQHIFTVTFESCWQTYFILICLILFESIHLHSKYWSYKCYYFKIQYVKKYFLFLTLNLLNDYFFVWLPVFLNDKKHWEIISDHFLYYNVYFLHLVQLISKLKFLDLLNLSLFRKHSILLLELVTLHLHSAILKRPFVKVDH